MKYFIYTRKFTESEERQVMSLESQISELLEFAATNEFKISYLGIGPTEIGMIFIIINTLIIFFIKFNIFWLLPYILFFSIIGLNIVVYRTQKYIWRIDMKNKNDLESQR